MYRYFSINIYYVKHHVYNIGRTLPLKNDIVIIKTMTKMNPTTTLKGSTMSKADDVCDNACDNVHYNPVSLRLL